ncbi:MAG: DegT/DnrJ/EryC1/StrS family aminotransferase [Pseudomonadota bacterium]
MAKIKIGLASPAKEYEALQPQIDEAVKRVLAGGKYILGEEVLEFEKEAAGYLGVKSAVGVSSGTDALLAALMALEAGPGSEVITTAFSFFATASTIARTGAKPVFVDIEEDGFNIDPGLIRKAITKKTKAVVVVHLFGQAAEMDEILRAARENNVAVIEDAAQAFGAMYGMQKAGTMGDYGCYSFFPAKPLGGAGDGGLVVCATEESDRLVRMLRVQGASGKNVHPMLGGNFRLDALQAAILRVKLGSIDAWTETRRKYAQLYYQKLRHLEGRVVLPMERDGTRCTWAQYSIRAKRRDELMSFMQEKGVGCEVYYPMPMPRQESMSALAGGKASGDFPMTERACGEILSIPIHPLLSPMDIEEAAKTLCDFYKESP